MKRNFLIFLFIVGFLIYITAVLAVEFTPQGDINLRDIYNIENILGIDGVNATFDANVTADKFVGDGSFLTGTIGNANSSDYWDNYNIVNATQFENNGGTLNIIASWFSGFFDSLFGGKDTDDLSEGSSNLYDNQSWNESWADTRYSEIQWNYNQTTPAILKVVSWNYYNSTDFSIADYSTTVEIVAFGYYNSTDFVITDYFTKSEITAFNYYNSTDFSISNYFTSAEVLAFSYYNSTDFSISDYTTTFDLLSWNYYNATDFVITDYYTKTQINNFNYYNLTDFDISNYYTSSQTDTEITSANTSVVNWVDDLFVRFTELVGQVGNWTLDKPNYYTKTEVTTNITSANTSAINWVVAQTYVMNNTDGWDVNFTTLQADAYLTDSGTFRFNFYDDGSEFFFNLTSIGDAINFITDNSKMVLYNSPSAGNNWKVFQIFSKEAGDTTEFVISKAKDQLTSYFVRSLALVGNGTAIPTPYNCSTFANYIDCKTDVTGPDFYVLDDVEINGSLYVGDGNFRVNDDGKMSGPDFNIGWKNLTDYPSTCSSSQYISAFGDTLSCASITYTESDPLWTANQSSYFTKSNILGFSYYNLTDFSIGDYFTKTNILNFGYYNLTDFSITNYYLKNNPFSYYNVTNPPPESDPVWIADKSSYWNTSTDLDTVISADEIAEGKIAFSTACPAGSHYYLNGNDLACETDDDTTYTASGTLLDLTGGAFSVNEGTLTTTKGCKYVSGTGLVCDQDYLTSFTESDPLAYNGTLAYLSDILGWSYYNSTDFSIGNYFTKSNILGFNYYNSTDFSISDYYLKNNPFGFYNSSTLPPAGEEVDPLWTANQSSYWKTSTDLDTVISTDEITELKIDFNTACAAGSHLYISGNNLACEADDDTTYSAGLGLNLSGTTFNHEDTSSQASSDNSGNTFIQDIVLDTFGHLTSLVTAAVDFSNYFTKSNILGFSYWNDTYATFNKTYADTLYSTGAHTTDTNASTICSGTTTYLDGEGNCDDISGVYEGDLSNEVGLYAALSDVSLFLEDLVDDTSPQLGGYLDTNSQNIGSTSDEIENIYVGLNARIYFGNAQETSIYYNGTVLIIG